MKGFYTLYCTVALLILYFSVEKLSIFQRTTVSSRNRSNIIEIIQFHTGVGETHHVHTEDGYILTFFQIPRKNPKGVILLQHSIFFDAQMWVSQYNDSIAFLFWKAGYDVWLGNTRGNFFCKEHETLASTDPAFWNFSFHEMGFYDHHATIDYIRKNTTQSKIIYLGYSMGATSGLVYTSTRPEDALTSLKLMIIITPVTHISRGTSLAKHIVPLLFSLQRTFNFVDVYFTLMRYDVWYLRAFRFLFSVLPCRRCLIYATGLLSGWNPEEIDPDLVDEVVRVFGSEVPLKVGDHFNQLYISGGKFRMYDYGEEGNLQVYKEKEPRLYPLENIDVPIFLVYGQNDSFTCPEDNEYLYSVLPEGSTRYGKLMVEDFNHADFTHGRNRNEKVYRKILKLLENI